MGIQRFSVVVNDFYRLEMIFIFSDLQSTLTEVPENVRDKNLPFTNSVPLRFYAS